MLQLGCVEAPLFGVFAMRSCQLLCGFALEADLQLAEVSVHSWPGYVAGEDLYSEIVTELADLVDERPDATPLLSGRTFARTLQ